jgi:hypothetical protein
MNQISIFEPQEINGQTVEPLCVPSENTSMSQTVAGATNLLWFAFHLALAERNVNSAKRIAKMLKCVVDDETGEEFAKELDDAIFMLDQTLGYGYDESDEELQ